MRAASNGKINENMPYYRSGFFDLGGQNLYVSRSGFTNELGFEIYSDGFKTDHLALWDHLMNCGKPFGMELSATRAMTIRRIEAGIFGNLTDIDTTINPFEAGLGFCVNMDKEDFIGRDALLNKDKAKEVVDFLNLGHLSNELAGNLSGRQKKLLELGRTMMVDAKLVLLDEVGAGVNRTLLKDLGTAIEKLNKEKGYTFCMIEHDMDFIGRLCDPVIVMAEGSVLFEGSVEEAKKDEKVIESYLGRGSKLKDTN